MTAGRGMLRGHRFVDSGDDERCRTALPDLWRISRMRPEAARPRLWLNRTAATASAHAAA